MYGFYQMLGRLWVLNRNVLLLTISFKQKVLLIPYYFELHGCLPKLCRKQPHSGPFRCSSHAECLKHG